MEKNTEMYLRDAAGALATIRREEHRIQALVNRARETGASWSEVGRYLDMSKQTAYARYGKDRPAPAPEASKISDTDVAGTSKTPSIFSDDTVPAKAASIHGQRTVDVFQQFAADRAKAKAEPALQNWDGAIDQLGRAVYWLEGPADATAEPGTGVGDHNCPRCQSTNHKGGAWHTVAAFPECEPTRFDPQNIVDWFYRSMKIAKTQEKTK